MERHDFKVASDILDGFSKYLIDFESEDIAGSMKLRLELKRKGHDVSYADALGYFLSSDDSPWALLMATSMIYALPPAALYYAVRRYMVSGLTAGAVKS